MESKLLSGNYKNDENFYRAFLNDTLWQSEYLSNESKLIPRKLPDFPIYLNRFDSTSYENDYLEMLHAMTAYVLDIDRDITMDECFWHSWLCLYQREYLLEKYPKIKEKYSNFKNIVIKKVKILVIQTGIIILPAPSDPCDASIPITVVGKI